MDFSSRSIWRRDKEKHHTPSSERHLWSTRFALIVGFGSLLLTMAIAGGDALRVLRQVRREDDQIRRQFLFRNHVLNDVRSDLYLSGTYVRDYLLEPEPVRADTFRASLEDVRRQMQNSLDTYGHEVSDEERPQYAELTAELERYWKTLGPILNWDASERRTRGYEFLRDEVFPRRAAMLDIAGQIAGINEKQLNSGNERVVTLLVKFQTRLSVTLLASLALGLGMAAFSTRRILRLEANSQLRYEETAEARRQLTNLSAKLVETQETERRALSRELHDEVGQALSAVLVELRNLSLRLDSQTLAASRASVEGIREQVEGTVRVVRNMALLLRPSMLDDLGLIPALRWQAREMSKRTLMDVSVATDLTTDNFPEHHKTCLYRVVQEALHNAERHSRATIVRIRVQQEDSRLSLQIQDDGRGFNIEQAKGLGLLGIEERVAQLGGTFRIYSEPGAGTILTVDLPLPASSEEIRDREPAQTSSVTRHDTDPYSSG
jgi:signal transduction histidine kinase